METQLKDDEYFRDSSIIPHGTYEIQKDLEKLEINEGISVVPFPTLNNFCKADFDVIELLGKGAYAKVVKAMHIQSKQIKAIKIIDRQFIEREKKLYQVYLENEILQRINHKNIIKIEGIFEENGKIFIVLEYLSNGDFFEFLKLNTPLKNETVQYYSAQLVNVLEYLHERGIAHRDLKPENIMLDENFQIKIIDFATCKIKGKAFDKRVMNFVKENEIFSEISNKDDEDEIDMKSDMKNTFVGTAEYVSPEVLCDQPAGPATDLWALGCIIYQMFTGFSPFKDKTEYLVFRKILEMKYSFPDSIPPDAMDLIKSLLLVDPTKRLGSGEQPENDFFALKSHNFFKGIDFTEINREDPPFKNEFKIKIKQTALVKSQNSEIDHQRHKNTIQIIKHDIIEKKSPWFHYNTRKVVLDNTPKIEYIDPEKNVVKGVIYLNKTCYARYIDSNIFELYTPKRVFKFRTSQYESGVWSKIINETIEKYSKI